MYTFKDYIDYKGFFFLNKKIIGNGTWAELSQGARSILPVILKYRDKYGVAFPSQETIGILSGVSEKTVSCAIRNIEDFTDIEIAKSRTNKGYTSYSYLIPSSMIKMKGGIRVHNALFNSGCWRMLIPSAKSLYIVLRVLAGHDAEDYEANGEYGKFNEWFGERKYDVVSFKTKTHLAELAGISRPSLEKAIDSLKKTELLANIDPKDYNSYWNEEELTCDEFRKQKICIVPEIVYSRICLNADIKKSHAYKQKRL